MTTMDPTIARRTWRTLEPLHGMIYFSPEAAAEFDALGLVGRMGYFGSRVRADGRRDRRGRDRDLLQLPARARARRRSRRRGTRDARSRSSTRGSAPPTVRCAATSPTRSARPSSPRPPTLARRAAETACEHVEGRPLFAGHASLPWPDEDHLVLWHAQTLLREYRGDGHIAALVTAGLSGLEAAITHVATGDVPGAVLVVDPGVAGRRVGRGRRRPPGARASSSPATSSRSPRPAARSGSGSRTRPTRPRSRPTSRSATTAAPACARSPDRGAGPIIDSGLLSTPPPADLVSRHDARVRVDRALHRDHRLVLRFTRPRDTQLCRSAQTSIGGSTTSALSSATATLTATMMPKSRSSGSDDARQHGDTGDRGERRHDERAAGPRRRDVDRLLRGSRPRRRSSTNRKQDQRRELGTRRDHEWSADRGHRTQREAGEVREQRRGPDRDQHRHERQQRSDDRPQPDREEEEHEDDREVGEQDPVRLEVVEQTDAHHREPRRRRADARAAAATLLADLLHHDRALGERRRGGGEDQVASPCRPCSPSTSGCRPARRRTPACTSSPVGDDRLRARAPR